MWWWKPPPIWQSPFGPQCKPIRSRTVGSISAIHIGRIIQPGSTEYAHSELGLAGRIAFQVEFEDGKHALYEVPSGWATPLPSPPAGKNRSMKNLLVLLP